MTAPVNWRRQLGIPAPGECRGGGNWYPVIGPDGRMRPACPAPTGAVIMSTPTNWALLGIGLLLAAYLIRSPKR